MPKFRGNLPFDETHFDRRVGDALWYLYVGTEGRIAQFVQIANPTATGAARAREDGRAGKLPVLSWSEVADAHRGSANYPEPQYGPDRNLTTGKLLIQVERELTDAEVPYPGEVPKDYKAKVRKAIVSVLGRTPSPEEVEKANVQLRELGLDEVEKPYKVVTVEVEVKVSNLTSDRHARRYAVNKLMRATEEADPVFYPKVIRMEATDVNRIGGV